MNSSAAATNPVSRALEQARESIRRKSWRAAYSQLSEADRETPLHAEDLECLAMAAHLIGAETESAIALARAHHVFLDQNQPRRAARCAFWLGFTAQFNGDFAKASGWFSRARRLLEGECECAEQGYLLLPTAIRAAQQGDVEGAHAAFLEAARIAERCGDRDLATLALQGQGRVLIRRGDIAAGVALLDEAMVAVTSGEVSPIVAGGIYCSVLDACGSIFDLRRAQEWTSALEQWCASQPDIVPYRGHCLVRRAELLQLHGDWSEAEAEARRACERAMAPSPKLGAGAAFYRLAEIHRLHGEFTEAEEAYRQASEWERVPSPGLAQLRFAQGRIEAAHEAIRYVLDEVREPAPRSRALEAYVDIAIAGGDIAAARAAAEELAQIAWSLQAKYLETVSCRATGAVLLAEKDPRGALALLRKSLAGWRDLEAPYEAARTRVLIALACREQGNSDTATTELETARSVFEQLRATPDLARLNALARPEQFGGPLTDRETEVLRLIASGATNRAIAGRLGISEKTVARHVSNIFTKLDLSSRAAATAYAYQHKLVQAPT